MDALKAMAGMERDVAAYAAPAVPESVQTKGPRLVP